MNSGTITKEQETAIENAFSSTMNVGKIPPQPPSSEDKDTDKTSSVLSNLVSAGVITQDQSSSIVSAFQSVLNSNMPDQIQTLEVDPLDAMVSSGTITSDQENSIKKAFMSAMKAYDEQDYYLYRKSALNLLT